jgi:CPA1 family monovalent cation:H+ antiporter
VTGDPTIDAIRAFVALIAVAGIAALLVRRLAIPYTVTLVVVGLAAATVLPRNELAVSSQLVLLVLVPGLVFEAALRIDINHLRRTVGGIALLAAPGVIISAAIVAAVLNLATGLPLGLGLVVGAIVAATDPVAVIATFRRLKAPRALATLVEGESLFNDGTALVVFAIAVKAAETEVSLGDAVGTFVVAVVVSATLGIVMGWAASRLIATVDDHLVEMTISVATAYGTYLVADGIHQSGVIATVVAGVVLGNYGRTHGMSRRSQEALDLVWEFLAFILTALAFLLVGLAIDLGDVIGSVGSVAWGVVGISIGRIIVVYGLLGGSSRLFRRPPFGPPGGRRLPVLPVAWLHVLFWAGLRGAVAVAMALAIPADVPQRATLQDVAFGIVLFTLFVQGTTAELAVRRASNVDDAPAAAS